jgi:hypothetical protein
LPIAAVEKVCDGLLLCFQAQAREALGVGSGRWRRGNAAPKLIEAKPIEP